MSGMTSAVGIAPSSAGVSEDEWSLLLAAFIGCFAADVERGVEEKEDDLLRTCGVVKADAEPLASTAGSARYYAFRGVRRALRYLVHDNDALRARYTLERVVDTLGEAFWRQLQLPQSSFPHSDEEARGSGSCDTAGGEQEMLQLLYRLAGIFPYSTTTLNAALPAELLYMVYYLAYTHCAPQAWQSEATHSRWAQLFFLPLLTTSSTATTMTMMTDVTAATELFSSQAHGLERRAQATEVEDGRSHVTQLFSRCMSDSEVENVLLFIDAYHAWLLRDYRGVLEHTEQLFQLLLVGGETQPCLLWVMLHSSRFMNVCATIAVTNMSHSETRDTVKERLQRMREEYSGAARLRSRSPVRGVDTPLHACPPLMRAAYDLLHCELSLGEGADPYEKGDDSCRHDEEHLRQLMAAESWQGTFLLTLRVWLRAKRLTEEGHMADSRDLLLHTLERLYDRSCMSTKEGQSFITVSPPPPAVAPTTTNSAGVVGSASGATREAASSSAGEGNMYVVVYLMPSIWLRQLLLLNCAALADTRTLLYFLHCLRQPLALAELLYLAVCPTLASGGVHSPILASFSMDEVGEVQSVLNMKELMRRMPLTVRVPLLSHRIWRLRQRLLQKLLQVPGEHAEVDDHRVSLQKEMIQLCESLVRSARGLFGSLELSFTDCVPHRVVFDAITMACDMQEDILHNAALSLATAPSLSSPFSPCGGSSSSSNNSNNSDSSSDEYTDLIMTGPPNTSATETNAPASLPPSSATALEGGSLSYFAPVTHASGHSRRSRDTTNPSHCGDGGSDGDGDSWLRVTCPPLLVSPSELSQETSFVASTAVMAQELYWVAYRKAHEWVEILQCFFPHLSLIVQVCQLRVTAAAFDRGSVHLARHLLAMHKGNPLVASHVALALFASLHVVSAERCIQEALQQYPHSAEIRRLYCAICGQNNVSRQEVQNHRGEEANTGRVKRSLIRPVFTHLYRGVLPVKYITCDHHGYAAVYAPLAMCLLCIGALAAAFVLHLKDVTSTAANASLTDDAGFRWSFVLPSTLSTYLGFGIVVYAFTAAAVIPFLASCGAGANNQTRHIENFLRALMEWNGLEDDGPNRLVFCLRGLPLVNLLTGVQLAVSNALRLKTHTGKLCTPNGTVSLPNACNRLFTGWGTVLILLLVFLLTVAVLFNGRGWRVVRYCDVMLGSYATFITIFIIDVAFFLFFIPFLFLCCVVLEPIMFFINAIFGVALASPLVMEHIPSVSRDKFLSTPISSHATATAVDCWGSMALSPEQVTSQVCGRLRASMPPLHWSPSRYHDCSLLCFHEVLQPLGKGGGDASQAPSGALLQVLRGLASRGVAGCASMQAAVNWRVHRTRQQSEAAVQLALLRESFTAAASPAPAKANSALNNVLGAATAVGVDKRGSSFTVPPRWKPKSATPYG
ncbi:hypothetical protein TraAM80_01375 [Trypanosoma rangeli]|uniref:Uncharacterized protein n=1 Tax=Trypanosoma rangeli TaxID=5698 RepID=A0A3R7KW14_TRYRA|nr:uncharacterized protein TraAM80_01375 [Trypanosoma rangeli]RNF10829.1 hypothetical protein TraAM80_01375 [Trypanosoma rangeli]|eukprot:RNF10829.1 hypothetical protein TraAM80_01375 [Trypanosoma rangeli]